MLRPILSTLLASALLCSARADDPTCEVWSYTGTDIYPSAIIATATVDWHAGEEEEGEEASEKNDVGAEGNVLGDPNGWVGARVLDVPEGATIKVEVVGEGWLKASKVEVTVEEACDEVIILPKGIFDYDALRMVTQQKPANLTLKVTVNDEELPEQTETVTLRSINECPFYVIMGDDEPPDDLTWMFAAYVNENHPWIDGILKEALDAELVPAFTGYQDDDPDQVIAQVFAIWNVMQRHGMKYSDVTNTPKSKFAYAQVVRFLDDSIKGSQANCVDGSVIFASILTKISIKCGLVMVPGHCFVCFDLDPEGELDPASGTCIGLETTMMGQDKLKPLAELKKLPAKVKLKEQEAEGKASAKTFLNAINQSGEVFSKNAKDFASETATDYQIIPIEAAREMGIMPIGAKVKP